MLGINPAHFRNPPSLKKAVCFSWFWAGNFPAFSPLPQTRPKPGPKPTFSKTRALPRVSSNPRACERGGGGTTAGERDGPTAGQKDGAERGGGRSSPVPRSWILAAELLRSSSTSSPFLDPPVCTSSPFPLRYAMRRRALFLLVSLSSPCFSLVRLPSGSMRRPALIRRPGRADQL